MATEASRDCVTEATLPAVMVPEPEVLADGTLSRITLVIQSSLGSAIMGLAACERWAEFMGLAACERWTPPRPVCSAALAVAQINTIASIFIDMLSNELFEIGLI